MLSNLKNWIWSDKKKNESSEKVIIPVSPGKNTDESPDAIKAEAREKGGKKKKNLDVGNVYELASGSKPTKGTDKAICLDDDEAWREFFSTTVANEKGQNKYRYKYNGEFHYTHEHKHNGRRIEGKISELIMKEMCKSMEGSVIKIGLKESRKEGKLLPAARIVLDGSRKEVNMTDILSGNMSEKYGIKSLTICFSNLEDTRGIRCRVDEDGTRIYEVANGSYDMTLNWYVEGKECKMKINISDDGSVKLIESNGVTWEQLAAHKEVKVGRQYEAKPLYEALSYLKQESSEIVEVSQQPSTSVTPPTKVEDVKTPQNIDQIIRDYHGV